MLTDTRFGTTGQRGKPLQLAESASFASQLLKGAVALLTMLLLAARNAVLSGCQWRSDERRVTAQCCSLIATDSAADLRALVCPSNKPLFPSLPSAMSFDLLPAWGFLPLDSPFLLMHDHCSPQRRVFPPSLAMRPIDPAMRMMGHAMQMMQEASTHAGMMRFAFQMEFASMERPQAQQQQQQHHCQHGPSDSRALLSRLERELNEAQEIAEAFQLRVESLETQSHGATSEQLQMERRRAEEERAENSRLQQQIDERLCVICASAVRANTVALPCGHVVGCTACAERWRSQRGTCSTCRVPIDRLVQIYFP